MSFWIPAHLSLGTSGLSFSSDARSFFFSNGFGLAKCQGLSFYFVYVADCSIMNKFLFYCMPAAMPILTHLPFVYIDLDIKDLIFRQEFL